MIQMIDEVSDGYTGQLSKPFIEFARRQLVNATRYCAVERRAEERHPMLIPAIVVPVDDDNRPIGDPMEVVTRDVASTSIGLFHEGPLRNKRMALRMKLAGAEVNLLLQVIWHSEMGPFFGSAGWYVKKLDEFPYELPGYLS